MSDRLKNTADEFQAYDMLPEELRRMIRESDKEISARKVLGRWIRNEYDTLATVAQLSEWMQKQ